jgi:hypothetical protein
MEENKIEVAPQIIVSRWRRGLFLFSQRRFLFNAPLFGIGSQRLAAPLVAVALLAE